MSSLYEPQTIDDLFFNKEEAIKLKKFVQERSPTLIHGVPGVGKTTSVHVISKELGINLVEINASDERTKTKLQAILERTTMTGLIPSIYFLDEVDGGIRDWSIIEKILTQSKHPVVLAANDIYNIPNSVKDRCNVIKYQVPSLIAVTDLIKKVSLQKVYKPRFDLLTKGIDFRSALLSSVYGGSRHEVSDNFKALEKLLKNGVIPNNFDGNILIWCLDNTPHFMRGTKLAEYILMLSRIDLIRKEGVVDRMEILSQFRSQKSDYVHYPNFLRRSSVLRKKEK